MNKTLSFSVVVLIVLLGIGFWSYWHNEDRAPETPTTKLPVQVQTSRTYRDVDLGFSITLPTTLASTANDSLYHVDTVYEYTALGEGVAIPGVKFTIPQLMNTGTNLSSDTYLSVEHLAKGQVCEATAFLGDSKLKSQTIKDGVVSYSFASSSEAAAGNRYEEYVYALPDSVSCLAVRYFIHYGAIENYDQDKIKAFNRGELIVAFDSIRKSLIIN